MKKVKYTKKAKLKLFGMAQVETKLRKAGLKKLKDLIFNDGRHYVGEVKRGNKIKKIVPHGIGFMVWPDGSSYGGNFFDGKFDEFGEYEDHKGKKKMGIWRDGKFLYEQKEDEF